MLTAEQIDALRDRAEEMARPITEYLLRDIAQRVKTAGSLTATASYQIYRAQTLGLSQEQIKRRLQKILQATEEEIEELLTQSAEVGYNFDLDRLPTADAIPFDENLTLQQIVSNAVKLTQNDFTNLTQTLGMVDPYGNVQPLQKTYQACMDYAVEKIATGAQDARSAMRDACRNLADYGVRVIEYESGVSRSIEAATRGCVMGGMGLLQEQISQENHDKLGADGWEISAHNASAPDHEPIQGKQYSDAEYEALNNSLKRRIGTLNCGHSASPIILGVSSPQYTSEELEEMRVKNKKGVTVEGKHYTTYEATQKQRQFERVIRKQKNRILVDESLNDTEQLSIDQIRLGRLQDAYKEFNAAANLRDKFDRAAVTGFDTRHAKATQITYQQAKKTEKIFTDTPENGTIEDKLYPITAESIKSVPKVPCEILSEPLQRKLQAEHKSLLMAVSGKPIGTEATATYSLDMKRLSRIIGEDAECKAKVHMENVPFIAIHNHPSGMMFSFEDIDVFARGQNMRGITVVGNNGAVYMAEKTNQFSLEKYYNRVEELKKKNIDYGQDNKGRLAYMEELMKGADDIGLRYYNYPPKTQGDGNVVKGTSS